MAYGSTSPPIIFLGAELAVPMNVLLSHYMLLWLAFQRSVYLRMIWKKSSNVNCPHGDLWKKTNLGIPRAITQLG